MKTIQFENKSITFVSTAHVSKESVDEVLATITEVHPDTVCVELDASRAHNLMNPNKTGTMDIREIIKQKRVGMFVSNLILSSYQKQIADDLGTEVGGEMKAAIQTARDLDIRVEYIDRNIQTTFKRLWNSMGIWKKAQLIGALIGSMFSDDDAVDAETIESLRSSDLLYKAVEELDDNFPEISRIILHERNEYMAEKIKRLTGSSIVVVLGAAHTQGVIESLDTHFDLDSLDSIPEKKKKNWGSWILPAILFGFIILFTLQSPQMGLYKLLFWFGISTALATLGAILSAAHPLTILVTFATTWVGILSPVLSVGMFAALTEAFIRPPLESEFQTVSADAKTLKGWYKNRILRIILVFILTSLMSSLGTFITGANFIQSLFK